MSTREDYIHAARVYIQASRDLKTTAQRKFSFFVLELAGKKRRQAQECKKNIVAQATLDL